MFLAKAEVDPNIFNILFLALFENRFHLRKTCNLEKSVAKIIEECLNLYFHFAKSLMLSISDSQSPVYFNDWLKVGQRRESYDLLLVLKIQF